MCAPQGSLWVLVANSRKSLRPGARHDPVHMTSFRMKNSPLNPITAKWREQLKFEEVSCIGATHIFKLDWIMGY